MAAILKIREGVFQTRLTEQDYEIYRDGFSVWVKNNRNRQALVLRSEQLLAILAVCKLPAAASAVEAMCVGDINWWGYTMPSDAQIIRYCIEQALVDHPVEEYA